MNPQPEIFADLSVPPEFTGRIWRRHPQIPLLEWAFGSPAEKHIRGGRMGLILGDSIYPYSRPTDYQSLPWWTPAPGQVGEDGAFPGFERNRLENGGAGAPNFPSNRHFNIVVLNCHGLKESLSAPFRPYVNPAEEQLWPHDLISGVTALLEFYVDRYLAPDTGVILALPERELMNLYAYAGPFPPPSPIPDPASGSQA